MSGAGNTLTLRPYRGRVSAWPKRSILLRNSGREGATNTRSALNIKPVVEAIMSDRPDTGNPSATQEIISRADAKARGLKTYFTGEPCKYGHIAERRVRCSTCVECSRAISKAWYANNKEASLAHRRQYQVENRAKISAMKKAWRDNNRQHYKAHRSKLRARRNGAEGFYTAADISAIRAAQKGRCAYCRTSLRNGENVDHIVALARGGTNWPSNLQLLCPPCNLRKHAKDPIAFAQERGLLL